MDEGGKEYEMEHVERPALPLVQRDLEKREPPRPAAHLAFYIALWIALSSAIVLFNKYIISTANFDYPILLTAWHMAFTTAMTQILARSTSMLDSRNASPMTAAKYLRAILPVGVLLSLCLMFGNMAYLWLTVSFIQMLKASMPVVTILVSWAMRRTALSLSTLANVSVIVLGVVIASYGEIQFVLVGVLIQLSAVLFDAIRLVLTQYLLTTSMDSLVLLYYLSPLCAIINTTVAFFVEIPRITLTDVQNVGYITLLANASVAFALNVATVLLISKTTSLVMTLCGVLKNIVLVLASMLFFHDSVSGLQAFGYSIALSGLLYYQLGSDNVNMDRIKEFVEDRSRYWKDLKRRSPTSHRLVIFGLMLLVAISALGVLSWMGALPVGYDPAKLTMGIPGGTPNQ